MDKTDSAICRIDDAKLIAEISAAKQRVVYVAPGINKTLADAVASAWQRLGGSSVSVIIDVDPEVCRLGYGTLDGLETIQKAAANAGEALCHQPGIRICILIADSTTIIYSPTPLLVEDDSSRKDQPNAIRLAEPSPALQSDLGITASGEMTRTVGLDPVRQQKVEHMKADLAQNPPVKFDIARKVRVFNSQLEFVEFELQGCFISRKTASLNPELMGLAEDEATRERLHGTFKVLGQADIVDEESKLSEKTLMDERKRIGDTYLTPIKGFGTVILRSNKQAFEKEVDGLRDLVGEFQKHLKLKLETLMAMNAKKLATALFPSVKEHPPSRWTRVLGAKPTPAAIEEQLLRDIRASFGSVEKLVKQMTVGLVFKGVTYETLTDPKFLELAQEYFPSLRLHEEYDAAREAKGNAPKRD